MSEQHDHVSDLRWDRLIAGELSVEDRAATEAAAAACTSCAARLAELTRQADAFAHRPSIVTARRTRWWLAAPAMLAAAAAIVFVMRARATTERSSERLKGAGPSLIVAAGAPGRIVPVSSGDRVRPGDHVQAGYSAGRSGFGAVLARDGNGKAASYVPPDGDVMVALPAGRERSFPTSTILDDVVGEEALIVVWCETARPLAPLLVELESRGDITPSTGCTHRRLVLDKRAGPR